MNKEPLPRTGAPIFYSCIAGMFWTLVMFSIVYVLRNSELAQNLKQFIDNIMKGM